jgi:hypothetical protein
MTTNSMIMMTGRAVESAMTVPAENEVGVEVGVGDGDTASNGPSNCVEDAAAEVEADVGKNVPDRKFDDTGPGVVEGVVDSVGIGFGGDLTQHDVAFSHKTD